MACINNTTRENVGHSVNKFMAETFSVSSMEEDTLLSDPSTSAISMDWLKKRKEKSKKQKDARGALLTPTASSVANLETNANNPAPSDIQHEQTPILLTTDHLASSVIDAAVDTQPEQTHRSETARGSRTDKWLSRAAFLLNLTKSAADAGGLAPLKGACEGVVTLLDAFQVSIESHRTHLITNNRM